MEENATKQCNCMDFYTRSTKNGAKLFAAHTSTAFAAISVEPALANCLMGHDCASPYIVHLFEWTKTFHPCYFANKEQVVYT